MSLYVTVLIHVGLVYSKLKKERARFAISLGNIQESRGISVLRTSTDVTKIVDNAKTSFVPTLRPSY